MIWNHLTLIATGMLATNSARKLGSKRNPRSLTPRASSSKTRYHGLVVHGARSRGQPFKNSGIATARTYKPEYGRLWPRQSSIHPTLSFRGSFGRSDVLSDSLIRSMAFSRRVSKHTLWLRDRSNPSDRFLTPRLTCSRHAPPATRRVASRSTA